MMGFFAGLVFSFTTLLLAMVGYRYAKLITKPKVYPVADFSTIADESGVYPMNFLLEDGHKMIGYTKKAPPEGTLPEQLEVKIRSYHVGRNKYRVFWTFKN